MWPSSLSDFSGIDGRRAWATNPIVDMDIRLLRCSFVFVARQNGCIGGLCQRILPSSLCSTDRLWPHPGLSDVLVAGASAVAAAQLAPIASCADEIRPDSVRIIPPLGWSVLGLWVLWLLLRFGLRLLEPVGDCLSFLPSGHLADLPDDGVLCCCASTSDCSVMSLNLCAVGVSPCGGVHIC